MYYRIDDGRIIETDRSGFEEHFGGIGIFDEEEWGGQFAQDEKFSLSQKEEKNFFCKLEAHASYLSGMFHIPIKRKEKRSFDFAVYLLEDRLIFVEKNMEVQGILRGIFRRIGRMPYTIGRLLADFFMALIEEDILYLASLECDIAQMEEMLLQGRMEHFHYHMLGIKKEISRLYCYYCQMADVGEILSGYEKDCRRFAERVERMKQETQSLREYAMQVQDVYQSEISIHQNNIMKMLTVVTTIFLPLSLIAGWYGMNFDDMPELRWQYGYPAVAAIGILILIGSLWFFKKKKFF